MTDLLTHVYVFVWPHHLLIFHAMKYARWHFSTNLLGQKPSTLVDLDPAKQKADVT